MTKEQSAHLQMCNAVALYCNDNPSIWVGKPFFSDPFNIFLTKLPLIQAAAQEQGTPTTGVTATKKTMRQSIEPIIKKFITALRAYAAAEGNNGIAVSFKITPSDIMKATDDAFIVLCTRAATKAQELEAAMKDYGIEVADTTAFATKTAEYTALLETPKVAKSNTIQATATLQTLLDEANELLREKLDTAAQALAAFDQAFTNQYFIVRRIDDPAYRTLALTIHIQDSASRKPMRDVEVYILPQEIKRKTSALGNCRVDNMTSSDIQVQCSKYGYVAQTVDSAVNEGETTELTILMTRE